MGFLSRIFGGKSEHPLRATLAAAVYADACRLFDRFSQAHASDHITGFTFVNVHDAGTPYVSGTSLEDGFGPVGRDPKLVPEEDLCGGFNAEPADWYWGNDRERPLMCGSIICKIQDDPKLSFEEMQALVYGGTVDGLKKFNETGKFKGKLPREQMLLMHWIHDPSDEAKMVMQWAAELNPPTVAKWFNAFYPYRDYAE